MGYWAKCCKCDTEGRIKSWDWQCTECGHEQPFRTRQCEECGAENGEGIEHRGKEPEDGTEMRDS